MTVNHADHTTPLRDRVPFGPVGPVGVLVDPATWRVALYQVLVIFPGLFWFFLIVGASAVSLALSLVVVGIPLLAVTLVLIRSAATLERQTLALALGVGIAQPYRPAPAGLRRRLRWFITDPATWKDLAYFAVLLPLGIVHLVVGLTLWTAAFAMVAAPILVMFDEPVLVLYEGFAVDTMPEAVLATLLGVFFTVGAAYASRGMGLMHARVGRTLLGTSEVDRLTAHAAHLQVSRARAVDAAEAERRRIERDLHDGAQQRLLAVAMELGRAQKKLDEDPEAVRELIESAHREAKAAIADLRNLARGIYPAILTDRGLDAALSALAARAPIRVDVSVEIVERPPAAVESIAYFTVAETLVNVAKHAGATEAVVAVVHRGDRVVVEVSDNGIGGAALHPGGGLAGLADRAATIDGTLTVASPPGGPTLIRAELPCVW
ncbi:sensor histidine kinase [Rhizohabitans arisaemae]|uniref:sensor histidine kinase n=1 Tax=Rhizohabitans arisaemae TaxID=2720610 RepID=UPI0024B09061|nr:sensor domain-containing protein [Rhizohabitans arisaemae]